jgi:hypothetical protein
MTAPPSAFLSQYETLMTAPRGGLIRETEIVFTLSLGESRHDFITVCVMTGKRGFRTCLYLFQYTLHFLRNLVIDCITCCLQNICEIASSSDSDADRYVINRNLLDSIFNVRYEPKFSFAILDKTKPDTGNTRGLNLAAVMFTTVQVSRLPLWPELLVSSRA